MGIRSGIHQIVRFNNGHVWHFYYKKERGIYFRQLGDNGLWEDPIELLIGVTEDFSLNIDILDNLHLICRAKTGEILYMKYDGKLWSRQVLSRFEPLRYVIKYPTIINIGSHIHIIFALGTTFNTGYWSLYHYHWDEKEWNFTEIAKYTAGPYLSPFNVEITDKHIHIVYRGLHSNRYQVFHCRYLLDHGMWSVPENVTHSSEDCNMPSILAANGYLHLTWVSLLKSNLSIRYKKKKIDSSNGWTDEIVISESEANGVFPYFLFLEGKLWCIWSQNDSLYASYSVDDGDSFSHSQPLDFQKSADYFLVYFRTNYPSDQKLFKLQRSYCSLDRGLKIPVLEYLLGLPEYNSAATPSPWDLTKKFDISIDDCMNPDTKDEQLKKAPEIPSSKPPNAMPSHARQSYALQTFEQVILKELERYEEHSYSILTKLEDNYKVHENSLSEIRQLLYDNAEMLHSLKQEIEHLKNDLSKSKGILKRIFSP